MPQSLPLGPSRLATAARHPVLKLPLQCRDSPVYHQANFVCAQAVQRPPLKSRDPCAGAVLGL